MLEVVVMYAFLVGADGNLAVKRYSEPDFDTCLIKAEVLNQQQAPHGVVAAPTAARW